MRRPHLAFSVLCITAFGPGQDKVQPQVDLDHACQSHGIRWHLPGDFDEVVKLARKQGRLILIKGISFGIDELGAKCATKGKW